MLANFLGNLKSKITQKWEVLLSLLWKSLEIFRDYKDFSGYDIGLCYLIHIYICIYIQMEEDLETTKSLPFLGFHMLFPYGVCY
jgi:hypothetical protein